VHGWRQLYRLALAMRGFLRRRRRRQRQTPLSSQRRDPEHGGLALVSRPKVTTSQRPAGAPSQRRHVVVQAFSQQTPSAQKPEPHWAASLQLVPSAREPTQVPPLPVQVCPAPQLAVPQQWPSTQWPLAHSPATVQVAPLAARVTHTPSARQVAVGAQALLSMQEVAQAPAAHR
jgi:hypothetical protein